MHRKHGVLLYCKEYINFLKNETMSYPLNMAVTGGRLICENCLEPVEKSSQHILPAYGDDSGVEQWSCKRAYTVTQAHIKERQIIDDELACERMRELIRIATIYCTVSSIGSEFFDATPSRHRFFYIRSEWSGQTQTIESIIDSLRIAVEPIGPVNPVSIPLINYYSRSAATLTAGLMTKTANILRNPKLVLDLANLEKVFNVIIKKGYILMFYDRHMEVAIQKLVQRGTLTFVPYHS